MTRAEVKSLLGDPFSSAGKAGAIRVQADSMVDEFVGWIFVQCVLDVHYERWFYGDAPSLFDSQESDFLGFLNHPRAHVVYFDDTGKVVKWRHPKKVDGQMHESRTKP